MQIVWFKRDLRVYDHEPLAQASKKGRFIALYILEPELWRQPDLSRRQYDFLCESLFDLKNDLAEKGCALVIRVGDAVEVLSNLIHEFDISEVLSHQETWNGWTYRRDLSVKHFLQGKNIKWVEYKQFGVVRRLKHRSEWSHRWYQWINEPLAVPQQELDSVILKSDNIPDPLSLGLGEEDCPYRQPGGRAQAMTYMKTFFGQRGLNYSKNMSSPVTAFKSCSRLSPYIAFGCLSLREIYHYCQNQHTNQVEYSQGSQRLWRNAHRSFTARLRWHCHFIQKLEDQPSMEFENLHPAYDELTRQDFNDEYFLAWQRGKTGLPMVDSCMRALRACGWINFRMRAMLISFASHHLQLDWRRTGVFLARQFTDYEPGIHYSQVQMQSGTTGINSIRVYNPIKQGLDHDPKADFITRWIPEISNLQAQDCHLPWSLHVPDVDYPMPIVNERIARTQAIQRLHSIRQSSQHHVLSKQIIQKHVSRRSVAKRRKSKKYPTNNSQQELSF